MLSPRFLIILLLLFISSFVNKEDSSQVTRWVIMKGGSLRVDGSTNINKFNCEINSYARTDTLSISKNASKAPVAINGSLILDVQHFDCHNPVMTSDLRKTLKAKTYPKLIVKFINLSRYPELNGQREYIKGLVSIELAGVTKRFEVDYKFLSSGANTIQLVGTRQVNFSDFNIVPPRKIGGMIQTNNELSVVFNLRMRVID